LVFIRDQGNSLFLETAASAAVFFIFVFYLNVSKMITLFRLILVFLMMLPLSVFSQLLDGKFVFPDIPGYHTLICDFHMHTVFSDGTVWPTVRVQEAVNEGLDAIAITEHLEYWSHKNYLKGNHNSSYEIAKPYADKNGLILIKACEITKGMPPGHFNFFFIKDANAIDSVDWKKAITQAREQGAFILWNHPGWRMENTIPVWYEEHSWLLSQGLLDGIEVVNENEYYPLAWQWCIDSNLTIFGNSDIHAPVDYFYDKSVGEHRPITLVFAKEKTEKGIREALDNGRTAIYYKKLLFGEEWILKELFYASVLTYKINSEIDLMPYSKALLNSSCVPIFLEKVNSEEEIKKELRLAHSEFTPIECPVGDPGQEWKVKNFIVAPGKCLILDHITTF
jgi:hypothetical protein